MGDGKRAGMLGAAGEGFVMGITATVFQGITCIRTYFLIYAARLVAANVSLSRAIVLGVPAAPGVELAGLVAQGLF